MDFLITMIEGVVILLFVVFLILLQIPINILGFVVNRMLKLPESPKFPDYKDTITGNLVVLVILFVIYILGRIF